MAGVAGAGLAAQKKSVHAAERDTERVRGLRREFIEALEHEDVTRFKFVDETSVNLTYTRRYGRAAGGRRVDQAVPLHNGPNVTVVAALTPQGVEAVMQLDGAVNTASFVAYVEQVLGPTLAPGDVVVLDNLRVHKAPGVAEAVATFGARLLFLPPYSPDFTPVELAFSKLKTSLRTAQARTRDTLTQALQEALDWISETDAKNWFDHCGYHVH
ncbi:IS630 family transposase [Hymenobacter amundsenii]|uniref:IS630 family transposase n=1 Tax=Hymenobacter amundsenii TaxID=2006685 RepID=UPI0021CDCAB8|nr:IS630 family transposase [Hymenobacter amundsenii]